MPHLIVVFVMSSAQPNEKKPARIDMLKKDDPIPGQEWGLFSFVDPGRILKKREMFYFERFVQQWDMAKSFEKFNLFINFIAFKYKLENQKLMDDLKDFVETQRSDIQAISQETADDYQTYLDRNEERLFEEFNVAHNFQTSVRSVKYRGSCATREEAQERADMLREKDGDHDIHIGPVGAFLIWDPDPDKTKDINYQNEELNELVHEKIKNDNDAKIAHAARVEHAKKEAAEAAAKHRAETQRNAANHHTGEMEIVADGTSVDAIMESLIEGEAVLPGSEAEAAKKRNVESVREKLLGKSASSTPAAPTLLPVKEEDEDKKSEESD